MGLITLPSDSSVESLRSATTQETLKDSEMNWPPFIDARDAHATLSFIERAASCLPCWGDPKWNDSGCDKCFSLAYSGDAFVGKGLYVAFCLFDDQPNQLQVTMHAERWGDKDARPDEQRYLHAERLIRPLLQAAGRLAKQRITLKRPRPTNPLRGKLKECFESFCHNATDHWSGGRLSVLHPYDYERFYVFIAKAHRWRSSLTPDQVSIALIDAGFKPEVCKALSEAYEVGRRVLMTASPTAVRADVWNPWSCRRRTARNIA